MHKITKDDINWARGIGFWQKAHLPSCVLSTQEDCAQAACVGLCEAAIRFDPAFKVYFRTFAFRAVAGAVINDLRSIEGGREYKRQTQEVHPPDSIDKYETNPRQTDYCLANLELDLLVKKSHLSPLQARILGETRKGLEAKEIASKLGSTMAAVYNLSLRTRKTLAATAGG